MAGTRLSSLSTALAVMALAGAATFASCNQREVAGIGLTMSAPQGVLDDATSVTLYVFPAGDATCGDDGGVGELPAEAQSFELSRSSCDEGVGWCGEITLDQDDENMQMFFVEVKDAGGLLAQGCAATLVDQDPLEVNIEIVNFVEPSCCGDGIVQVGELCDNGGDDSCGGTSADAICTSECTTRPLRMDDNAAAQGPNGLSIAFTPGEGQLDGGLRAAWNFATSPADVALRILQSDLSPVTEPAIHTTSHRVYLRCSGSEELPLRDQKDPRISAQGNGAVVAYISNEEAPLRSDARVLSLNSDGCSDMLDSLLVSNSAATVDSVDVATGPDNTALVVWQQSGKVFGRTFDGRSLGTQTITLSDNGTAPRVAGYSGGWVVVYQGPGGGDEDGVLMRRITSDLSPGEVVLVNAEPSGVQNQADVAVTGDGSVGVVYASNEDVFLQRFSPADAPVDEDRAGPVHLSSDGVQGWPAIAPGASGAFFVAAWESGNSIRARFAGKSSGFLANNFSGQKDDFEASSGSSGPKRPAVAAGEFVAIGWEDASAGIVVRRFPQPK